MKNTENQLFELAFVYEFGNNADKRLSTALSYLKLLGTKDKSVTEINQEFYRLGCNFNLNQNGERTQVSLTGLSENFEPALKLMMEVLSGAVPDETSYNNLVDDIIKSRANAKLSKNIIIRSGLMNYGMYGSDNPFTKQISETELKSMNPADLTNIFKSLGKLQHKVTYYGPLDKDAFKNQSLIITLQRICPFRLLQIKSTKKYRPMSKVYFVDYKMKQVEIMFINRSGIFTKETYL